jgi:Ca2+-binding RTX toxin-like protein
MVTEATNGGNDLIAALTSYTIAGNVEAMFMLGSGLTGTGSAGADTLLSAGGPNTLIGLGGDDIYYVGNAADVVTEVVNDGFDSVFTTVSYTLPADVEVMYLNGSGLTGTGTSSADTLVSLGANTLVGGLGSDAFVFLRGSANAATVSDFDGTADEHDYFVFSGFGTAEQGATFTQRGASNEWLIHSGLGGPDEVITLSNNAVPHAGDYFFV